MKLILLFVLPVAALAQWQYAAKDDQLHAKVLDQFVLEGEYLTPPSIPTTTAPALVVVCSSGRVEQSYFNVGTVVDHLAPVGERGLDVRGFEMRIDGKKYTLIPDKVSTDGKAVYFIRGDLKSLLAAKQVIVGVNELAGPQVVIRFDVPGAAPVLEKCGADRILRTLSKP